MLNSKAAGRRVAMIIVSCLLVSCSPSTQEAPEIDRTLSFDAIDTSIYFPDTDVVDPFAAVYAAFRERKAEAMADPEMPPPIEPYETVHRSSEQAWAELDEIFPFDPSLLGGAETSLARVVKAKRVFDHPDLEIIQLMLGSQGTLPAHAEGAPGVLLVVDGTAEITVEGETHGVTPGAKIKLEPYVVRQIHATSEVPFKALWIRWAPRGDHRYIKAGYYLTGANQHVQPEQALIDPEYPFWGETSGLELVAEPLVGVEKQDGDTALGQQWRAFEQAKQQLGSAGTSLYPGVATFGHERDTPWLDEETIRKSNFMWAKDVLSTGALLERWAEVVRMEGLFQARRDDGTWDFNISQQAWGSGARYVEHSHSIPEFYYMLSGNVEHWNGDQRYDAQPGDVFMTNSYQNHQSRVAPAGEVWRSYGATWAPGGDRTVFDRPFFLLAALPTQPDSAALGDGVVFH